MYKWIPKDILLNSHKLLHTGFTYACASLSSYYLINKDYIITLFWYHSWKCYITPWHAWMTSWDDSHVLFCTDGEKMSYNGDDIYCMDKDIWIWHDNGVIMLILSMAINNELIFIIIVAIFSVHTAIKYLWIIWRICNCSVWVLVKRGREACSTYYIYSICTEPPTKQ